MLLCVQNHGHMCAAFCLTLLQFQTPDAQKSSNPFNLQLNFHGLGLNAVSSDEAKSSARPALSTTGDEFDVDKRLEPMIIYLFASGDENRRQCRVRRLTSGVLNMFVSMRLLFVLFR